MSYSGYKTTTMLVLYYFFCWCKAKKNIYLVKYVVFFFANTGEISGGVYDSERVGDGRSAGIDLLQNRD